MIPFALLFALTLIPMGSLPDLSGVLERGGDASYGAEQVVSCATPDGVTSTLMTIEQSEGEILVGSGLIGDTSISTGAGGWTMVHGDGIVDQASVTGANSNSVNLYTVIDQGGVTFLGREATAFRLERDGLLRAELVLDDVTGVIVRSSTFDADGDPYCVHRFISFDPGDRLIPKHSSDRPALVPLESASGLFPDEVAGFTRLDEYEDEGGVRFTYYSDGFFSFALFQTPAIVALPEGVGVVHESGHYQRAFTAGQVFYSWEVADGGMAMVGDLPPDLHEAVLIELPDPERPGLLRRIWRSIFGLSVARVE